jgi:hypothetical protein
MHFAVLPPEVHSDLLSKLADLRDNGALTEHEFNEQKQPLPGGR